jgi:tyrosinase
MTLTSAVGWITNFLLCRSTFSTQERTEYINAVLHLQTLPSKLDRTLFPGARTRYDDFVGVHINQTLSIHFTVRFLFYQIS